MWFIHVYFLFGFFLYSNALIDNPCLTNFRMENVEYIGEAGEYGSVSNITRDCYNGVENQTENVYSTSSKSRCWLNAYSLTQIVSGVSINRCGVCLLLHGPSMEDHYCTVVGGFNSDVSTYNDILHSRKLIFVDGPLYELVSGYTGDKPLSFPVNMNLVDCPYSVYPAAVVTDISPSEDDPDTNIAYVNLINTNLVISKIVLHGETYRASVVTCLYEIPVTENGYMKIYNLLGDSAIIPFKFNSTDIQLANSPLPSTLKPNNDCDFRISLNIIGNETESITDDFFKWVIRYSNSTNFTGADILSNVDSSFSIPPNSSGVISFTYPIPHIASKLFGYYYLEFEVSSSLSLPSVTLMTWYGDDFEDATIFKCSNNFVLNYVDTDLPNGNIRRTAKISIRLTACYGLSNVWMLGYNNVHSEPQEWIVHSMYMTDATERTYYECDNTKYYCSATNECDPTNSTIEPDDGDEVVEYDDGCVPFCGTCKTGYVCNQAAKCVKTPNYNQRSGAIIPLIMLVGIIMFIL
ncbi:Uncharacterized protein QTN25_010415 [Entamoeba marina]